MIPSIGPSPFNNAPPGITPRPQPGAQAGVSTDALPETSEPDPANGRPGAADTEALAGSAEARRSIPVQPGAQGAGTETSTAADNGNNPGNNPGRPRGEDEQRQIDELKSRDREVRAHEAAHKAAAGALARGSASFTYQQGPDGRRYAVGGEVSIDVSPVADDPQATLRKAETIRAAALAPAQPSQQDRSVAAKAGEMAANARAELASSAQTQVFGKDEATAGETPSDRATAPGIGAYRQTTDATASVDQAGGRLNLSV